MNDEAEVGEGEELICSASCSAGGDIAESETNLSGDVSSGGNTDRLVSETALTADRPFLAPMKGSKLSGRFDFGP
jgi:hypothetical protein